MASNPHAHLSCCDERDALRKDVKQLEARVARLIIDIGYAQIALRSGDTEAGKQTRARAVEKLGPILGS